ncbi:MAG: pseudouridine synthase [Planctomycetaceae bacterium]|nr:pseudouridine synthase [Planctomycetaceae bacterium]
MSTQEPPMNDDSSPAPAKSLGELAAEAAGHNLSEAPLPTEEATDDFIEDEFTDTSAFEDVEADAEEMAESDWSDEDDSLVDEHEFDEDSEDAGAIPETTTGIRLQRYLAACGLGSRRQCEELITTGRIGIDGETVTVLGTRIDPQTQKVTYDGDPLKMERKKYYMLNKPSGFICTNRDPQGRPRVVDLFPDFGPRLFTIGRLDENTTGLLLVTNDGDLAQRLAHPKYRIYRRYRAQVAGYPSKQTLDSLKEGFYFTEGKFRVHDVRVSKKVGRSCWVEITMGEGQNREIRRLFARVGHKVMKLERIGFGPLRLGRLPAGQFRDITRDELAQVHSILQRNMSEPPGFESDEFSDDSESRSTRDQGERDSRRPGRPQGRRRDEGEARGQGSSRGPRYGRRDEEQGERRPPRAGSAGGGRFKRRDDNEGGEGRPRYEGQRGRGEGERRPPRAGSSGGGRFQRRDDSEGGEGRSRYEGQRGRGEGERRPPRAGSSGGGRFKRRDDNEGGEGRSRYEGQRGRGEGERRPPRAGSSGGGRFKRRDDHEGGEGRPRYEGQRGRGDNDRRGGAHDGERQQRRTGQGGGGGRGPRFSGGGSQGEGRPARGNRTGGGSGGRFGGDKRRGGPSAGKKPGRKGPPRGGKR